MEDRKTKERWNWVEHYMVRDFLMTSALKGTINGRRWRKEKNIQLTDSQGKTQLRGTDPQLMLPIMTAIVVTYT